MSTELDGRFTDEIYQDAPIMNFEGTYWISERAGPVPVQLAIHPNKSGRIIINFPGVFGDIDGYSDKYKKLATHIQKSDLGAVVRAAGWDPSNGQLTDTQLLAAIEYARENAEEICGNDVPDIMLMGFSAGASSIAATASLYIEIPRILLYAPSGDIGEERVKQGLEYYRGEVYIVVGENDEVVGPEAGQIFYDLARMSPTRKLFLIPNCDHQFRGETNGRIMSQAPFYAFATGERPDFPNPNGGIKLYD